MAATLKYISEWGNDIKHNSQKGCFDNVVSISFKNLELQPFWWPLASSYIVSYLILLTDFAYMLLILNLE